MAVSTTTTTSCATTFTSMLSSAWYVFCFACLNVFRISKFSDFRTAIKGLFQSNRSGHEVHISESRVLAIKNQTNNTFVYAPQVCRCSPATTAWADLPQSPVEGLTGHGLTEFPYIPLTGPEQVETPRLAYSDARAIQHHH